MGLIRQHSVPHSTIWDHARDRVPKNNVQHCGKGLPPILERIHKIQAEKIHDMLLCNSMRCVSHCLRNCYHVALRVSSLLCYTNPNQLTASLCSSHVSHRIQVLTSWTQSEFQCTLTVATGYLWTVSAWTQFYTSSSVMICFWSVQPLKFHLLSDQICGQKNFGRWRPLLNITYLFVYQHTYYCDLRVFHFEFLVQLDRK